MAVRVLIVSPDTGFGGLIQQTLERSGEYEPVLVPTGRQALEIAKQAPIDLAILDEDTADLKVGELGPVMQTINTDMRIVLIPVDAPDMQKKTAGMRINGYLTKPFYLPDLVEIVDSALAEAPATDVDDDRLAELMTSEEDFSQEAPALEEAPEEAAPGDATWLGDINLAAQHLARLTMSTSSQAALVLRQNKLWAYAGQLSREAANELAEIVQSSWQPDTQGERGSSDERDIDLARFVHLKSTGNEHLLYATHLENDLLLVLAFDARTPFSEIRIQANSMAAALASPYQNDLKSFQPLPKDAAVMAAAAEEVEHENDMGWALEFDPWQEEPSEDEQGINLWGDQGEAVSEAASQDRSWHPAAQDRRPQGAFAAAQTMTMDSDDDPDSTQPVRVNQAKPAGEPAGSSAIFDLHYACLLVPRLPEHYLIGDLTTQLSQWMRRLSLAFGWRLEYLAMRPDWLQWIAGVEPDTSAEHVVRVIRRSTSDLIFAEFPRFAAENPSDDFWAPGFLVITSQKPLPGDVVKGFIDRTRLRQGVPGED